MPPSRRKGRSIALQALYEIDLAGHPAETVLKRLLEQKPLSDDASQYVQHLVRGVLENRVRIDETITRFAPAFPLHQLSAIDRNILRLAIYELLIDNMTPERVAINEAVELAKAFGSDSSPRFVNGVLASVCSQGGSATG
jgi:N utilization substance protein B